MFLYVNHINWVVYARVFYSTILFFEQVIHRIEKKEEQIMDDAEFLYFLFFNHFDRSPHQVLEDLPLCNW